MINVYSKTTTVFDNNGLATLIPISCEVKIDINGAWQLTMEHPFDREKRYQYLEKDAVLRVTGINCVREWDSTTQFYRIYDTKKTLTSITVIAFPLGMEATYDAPIESLVIGDKTGASAASDIDSYVKNHDGNTKYTISSNVSATARSQYENTNLIAAISGSDDSSFINTWGGEVVYDNYKIKIRDIVGDQSQERAYPIRYGRNLMGLTHEVDTSSVITRIYPISSDDLRLNTWSDVTDQGGTQYVDTDSTTMALYPFIRAYFCELSYSLLDTNSNSHSKTADSTEAWRSGILSTMTTLASGIWDTVLTDLTNTYEPGFVQDLIKGDDGVVGYLQRMYSFAHKGWQSFVKSQAKQSVEWIDSEELPVWEWHEDTSVTPHAWWYGDNSTSPSTSYAKNEFVKIGKAYEYFNDDGYWLDYRSCTDMQWHQSKSNGKWWYGDQTKYYAHNEYVYMTVDGVMKEWWYDEEGWYDEDSSGDSDFDWHWSSTDQAYWFGEEGASADDKSKYLHDCWRFIDGTYYWFDQWGYTDADPAHSMPNYQWGDHTDDKTGKSWFGNPDENYGVEEMGAYIKSQWMKIDGEWYYFDSSGYMVDMDSKRSDTIAWIATSIYNNSIAYVKTCLTQAYTLLYEQMTDWCEYQYDHGLDSPSINITVDLLDLSKTSEYLGYSELERISLGDKVLVIDKDGNEYGERVLGLTFDCIRGYNTKVEVGGLSKSVSQIMSVSFQGTNEDTKLIAGDGVYLDGKVISVGDYVGRAIGLQDAIMNGSSIVSGNVAEFGIEAGSYITVTRSGNVLTINGERGGNKVFYGTTVPSPDLGENGDCYLRIVSGSISQTYYKVEGTWSIEPTGGLTYWVEDTNKIYRHVSNSVDPWDCDSAYKHGQFQIVNPVSNWIIKSNENTACCAWYSFNGNSYPMVISTVQADAIVHIVFHSDSVASFTVNGVTLYYSYVSNNPCWGDCTISGDEPPFLGDFTDKYHELGDDGAATQAYVRDYLMQISHFCTTSVKYSGIGGNNSDFVAWGGDYYSVGDENPTPDDMPFFVRKDGEVNGSAFKVNGKSVQLDTLVDGASVVGNDGIGRIALASVYATKTELAAKQDTLIAGSNVTIGSDGKTISANDTTYSAFGGATSSTSGTSGLVPAPSSGDQDKVLCGDGTWVNQSGGVTPVEKTWAQYQQLTPQEKADATKEYFVTGCPDDNYLTIVNGKLCIVYDDGQ